EQHTVHERPRANLEVRAFANGVEVRARSADPTPVANRAVECREAFLPVAVDVVRQLVPGLLHGFEERCEQRIRRRPAFERDRAVAAAVLFGAGIARLLPLEVRPDFLPNPPLQTRPLPPPPRT